MESQGSGARNQMSEVRSQRSVAWLGNFPGGVVVERKNLLNPLSPAAAEVAQHFKGLANFCQPWLLDGGVGAGSATDAVQNTGQIEKLAAGFEEVVVQGAVGGERGHGGTSSL